MAAKHHYKSLLTWTGNKGSGTQNYKRYDRSYDIRIEGKPTLSGSSDPAFRGDSTRHNPEDMLLASISSCHMLWYLHLCSVNKIVVTTYEDPAVATMTMNADGSGQFSSATLNPQVTVSTQSDSQKAYELHHEANKMCFIARSMNFPINHKPTIKVAVE
ncbi:OsmC family protein [Motiliproteus sp. MSK22-1]|uniref:OsmC family protein n=1 Tax=Motiliproteus sp. MSK22-1 TaxID=1897630 RepID=UPI0009765347|nr:OsmC family protein [Motiliproteus sp. MSK22-1]OMH25541.1 peroxiredoxin [Motiliproteus sp. MSK22-1]